MRPLFAAALSVSVAFTTIGMPLCVPQPAPSCEILSSSCHGRHSAKHSPEHAKNQSSNCLICSAGCCPLFAPAAETIALPANHARRWRLAPEVGLERADPPPLPPPRLA